MKELDFEWLSSFFVEDLYSRFAKRITLPLPLAKRHTSLCKRPAQNDLITTQNAQLPYHKTPYTPHRNAESAPFLGF